MSPWPPLPEQYIAAWRKNIAGLDGDTDIIDWKYRDSGYLKLLEAHRPATNLATLVPHGNVRMAAMGLDGKPASCQQVAAMCRILECELQAGAYGLSTGLIYNPCAFRRDRRADRAVQGHAQVRRGFRRSSAQQTDDIIASTRELISIAQQSGVALHISHMKVCGRKNWGLIDEMLGLLEDAQASGIRVSFDHYPYVAGSTMLGVIRTPPWVHAGGTENCLNVWRRASFAKNHR